MVSKLKSGNAAGICGIPVELSKAGGEPMVQGLYAVLATIWQSGTIPPNLLSGVVISLCKKKGDQWDFSHHRSSCIPGKVLTRILQRHIRDQLLRHQRAKQTELTLGKSTTDHILAL